MQLALNHMTAPGLDYVAFLDLAKRLGCAGVEVRNDLDRPLFDCMDAAQAGQLARDRGLRLFGLSQVYPFNSWSPDVAAELRSLIATAKACGAETISLIPRNDGLGCGNGERQANLRIAIKEILPMLRDADLVALIEPLGFPTSSLRSKTEAIETIDALGAADHFKLVHDTFHHHLADGGPIYPDRTGMVHISAVVDPSLSVADMRDEHRVLVDASDRLENIEQIAALLAAGYSGPISYECFAPEVHDLADAEGELARSIEFIASQLRPRAA